MRTPYNPNQNPRVIIIQKLYGKFFNDDEDNFHINLKLFLSQPLSEIERLWQEKKVFRENIIREYFSLYSGGAGERAAKVILKEYL